MLGSLRIVTGLFLLLVVVEGAIRKWVLPEYSNIVFGLKDLLIAFAFSAYVLQDQKSMPPSADMFLWGLWVALAVGFTMLSGLSFESLVGLRYYLAPLPLIVLVPALIRDAGDLDRLAVWIVRITFPIGILAVIQYFSPVDSPLNAYAWGGDEVSSFGSEEEGFYSGISRARVTSTFSYISTYAAFLSASWILAWLSAIRGPTTLDRRLAGLALVLIGFNMAMNGSRSLLLTAIATGLPFAWVLVRQLGALRVQLIAVVSTIVIGYAGLSIFEPFALTAARGADEEEALGRVTGMLLTPIATFSSISVLGEGIGSSFGGFVQMGERTDIGEGWDEVNIDRIGLETGYLGYFLLLIIKFAMLFKAYKVFLRLAGNTLRYWALAALIIQLGAAWQIPFYNFVAAVFYFGAIGLVYWLDEEERRQRADAMDLAESRPRGFSPGSWGSS